MSHPASTIPVIVPAPQRAEWRDGVCQFVESEVRLVRDASLPPEGYRIDIAPDGVTVASADDAGAFYAMRTLRQIGRDAPTARPQTCGRFVGTSLLDEPCPLPCGTIEDAPAFRWRGLMLDEARHFFGKETVKSLLDLMADHKLNVFHWHLSDDQGWRLDVPGFPELVEFGAVRPETPAHGCTGAPNDYRGNGQPYGPFFYTSADIRDILAYARERFIEVVPEIEIPGHIRALLAAHPEFSCGGNAPRVPRTHNSIEFDHILCAGNDEAVRFLERLYDAVCDLFPGTFLHIGGDECFKESWKKCPKCQERIRAHGLKDEEALQGWITRHFTDYLSTKGRRAVGWDEILAGNPGKETLVESWRGSQYATEAASRGHDVVVADVNSTYFSIPQGIADDPFDYYSPTRCITLAQAYAFDPLQGVPKNAAPRILGGECCLWSECTWNEYDLAWKTWPRACAFAEAVWTAPAPRDFADFRRRMAIHRQRLLARHILCAPLG